ncbi:hypothetical protein [Francisella sp. TX07-6608]|uniref:hypothetical protein n=1 Tax=Francisella sp. TX07-6608 TaxID=573568 RepID=UPI0008F9D0CA|nr:hypothetical protein [Francisella sp. TX07-6608]OIN83918.1 hypothetical protein KX00_179 [Francisella sp. TX07-6608]
MFNFELTREIIKLPDLLTNRWKNSNDIQRAKTFGDIVNLIAKLLNELDNYVDFKNLVFTIRTNSALMQAFKDDLRREEISLKINRCKLSYDKKLYRNIVSISNFFDIVNFNDGLVKDYDMRYSSEVNCRINELDQVSIIDELIVNVSIDDIFFYIEDVKAFEQKYNLLESNNEISNQESKEPIREVEVIKEIEKPQPYLDTNHPNYSSRLTICIDIWNYLFLEGNYNNKISIKENISRWNKKTNQQLELSDSLINAMQSILNFDNGVDRTGKLLKGYIPKIQKN